MNEGLDVLFTNSYPQVSDAAGLPVPSHVRRVGRAGLAGLGADSHASPPPHPGIPGSEVVLDPLPWCGRGGGGVTRGPSPSAARRSFFARWTCRRGLGPGSPQLGALSGLKGLGSPQLGALSGLKGPGSPQVGALSRLKGPGSPQLSALSGLKGPGSPQVGALCELQGPCSPQLGALSGLQSPGSPQLDALSALQAQVPRTWAL
ncbi:collagen alpha-1(X) chain-like [Elephas maximus indicus]|uniref:collagen alpha-1(X) chain-like n=1 Tax=Elephas maximus indicus TaxID=99487 RepID=UPI00211671F8|nr:collagen alpha-1(X) chain-like [Elephas maximus indicus]